MGDIGCTVALLLLCGGWCGIGKASRSGVQTAEFVPNCLQGYLVVLIRTTKVKHNGRTFEVHRPLVHSLFYKTCLDPMQSILNSLEQQHEEEKRSALERQRLMYEHELEQLRRRLSPEKQSCRTGDRLSFHSPSAQQRLRQWAEER